MEINCRSRTAVALLLCTLVLGSNLVAADSLSARAAAKESSAAPIAGIHTADDMRVQGEQRFRANCGRCHAAPQKFPPRMMGTILRHMRVRATITDEDRRLILFYMTQ